MISIISHKLGEKGKKALIVLFWLAVWQGASWLTANSLVLVGPLEMAAALGRLAVTGGFWQTLGVTFLKILAGFFTGFLAGFLLGSLSFACPAAEELAAPPLAVLRAVPMASFVILLLIWAGSRYLSVMISAIVVLPVVYTQILSGLKNTDPKLRETAKVFRMGTAAKIRYLYLPSLIPWILTAGQASIGMAWKSGIAAEIIGTPDWSVGGALYLAKIYLSTDELFAWTFAAVCLSALSERLFAWVIRQSMDRRGRRDAAKKRGKTRLTGNGGTEDSKGKGNHDTD